MLIQYDGQLNCTLRKIKICIYQNPLILALKYKYNWNYGHKYVLILSNYFLK